MTDRLSREVRSWNMSRIRSGNTGPECAVRSILHRLGYRFRLHAKSLPGKPDVVLPRYTTALFVHGCFWHRHAGCAFAYTPKSRVEFWTDKFAANQVRDRRAVNSLRAQGWNVIVVWECELRDIKSLSRRLDGAMRRQGRALKRKQRRKPDGTSKAHR